MFSTPQTGIADLLLKKLEQEKDKPESDKDQGARFKYEWIGFLAFLLFLWLYGRPILNSLGFDRSDIAEIESRIRVDLPIELRRQRPFVGHVLVDRVSLIHQGGNLYVGFVDVAINGRVSRVDLEVTYDGEAFLWKTGPQFMW